LLTVSNPAFPQPTNHLDIDALDWLADYLRPGGRGSRDLTVLLVTHDRYFLERVCNESTRDDFSVVCNAYLTLSI
jgi:ATP-binding cassette subfamily F protein uup